MSKKRIVVVGSNVAGYMAAIALKQKLRSQHDVTVISRLDRFVFHPSLIRVPLGGRTALETGFEVRAAFADEGIAFRHEAALRVDLDGRRVITATTEERYDFLVLATGAKPNYGAVPGLGPRGYTQSITTLSDAEHARVAFETLLRAPGPVVIGDVQHSSGRPVAWEFLLNMGRVLEQRGLTQAAPLTHLTSAGAVGSGRFTVLANASVAEITPGQIRLADGRKLPFAYAMLMPPFCGVDAVRACERITDADGFVHVNAFHQTTAYPEVFAAGSAVSTDSLEKSGARSEQMAQLVARNIEACINGEQLVEAPARWSPPERLASSDDGWLVPGSDGGWAQLAFARYFPAL